jgi:hypothetical protein
MDFGILANLLRNLDDYDAERVIDNLSLYRIDLDYNVSWEVMEQLSRWKRVELDYCEGDHVHAVISHIFKHSNIQRLRIISSDLDSPTVHALGMGLQSRHHGLKELSLTIDMPTETTRVLCQAINHHQGGAGSGSLLQTTTPLVSLDLSQCDFGCAGADDAIAVLCQGLQENTSLVCLKLENCRLDDDEVADLARSLRLHPTLQELSLRMNYAEDESISAIADLLRQTPALARLDLGQQNPGVLDLVVLAQALQVNQTLRRLNVKESYVFDAHMQALAETLATQNSTLQELNLENCGLRDSGLAFFMERLSDFRGLTKLWLKENRFHNHKVDDDDVLLLLKRNRTLQILDLEDEILVPPMVRYHLCLNRGGRKFLTPNSVPLSLWPMLLARVNRLVFDEKKETDNDEDDDNDDDDGDDDGDNRQGIGAPDVLYYLLQGPALFDR